MRAFRYLRLTELKAGLLEVVLDRPPANAINEQFIAELGQAAADIAVLDARVVLLRSSSDIFMAGADLVDMVDEGWDSLGQTIMAFQGAVNRWEEIPAATVAVINGHAAGGGCEVALACGWRLMARGSPRIGLPEARRGLLPAGGGTQRMARAVGPVRALDFCVRGRMLDADQAESAGLVPEAVDAYDLDDRALELADDLLSVPRKSLQAIKRCVQEGFGPRLERGLEVEAKEMAALGATLDAHEGVRAFVEKRLPVFVHD